MPSLFEETRINALILKNRFVRSATWEGLAAPSGEVTDKLIEKMVELTTGGVGLIISGHAYVEKEGQAGARQLGAYDDDLMPGLRRMTDAVHTAGGKIVMQLAHAGIQAPESLTHGKPFGPSAFEIDPGVFASEMDLSRIRRTIEAFGNAAGRAQQSGFDGVQLHGAHGYLLSQFLSPFFNRRTDDYGGNLQNRCRIVLEVCRAVRERAGAHYPLMIKMNSNDFLEGGITEEDMVASAALLQKAGVDAVELSGGTRYSGKMLPVRIQRNRTAAEEVYYRSGALRYKEKIGIPLMLVGGIRSFETAEDLVKTKTTDYVSLSRPLIREPNLIRRWESGDTRKACCISDNLCFKPIRDGNGMYCLVEERSRREA
jgi:2,4-dienoyl-CoA reductase-like NADH-dependent reductase (Old Yellow Enzyme family)